MSLSRSFNIRLNNLVFYLDPNNIRCYSGDSNHFYNLVSDKTYSMTGVNDLFVNSEGIVCGNPAGFLKVEFAEYPSKLFDFNSIDFTVMVWNKTISSNTNVNGIICGQEILDEEPGTWGIIKYDNQVYYNSRVGSTTLSFPTYTLGKFHCYAFTKTGTTLINYFDGVESNRSYTCDNPANFSNNFRPLVLGSTGNYDTNGFLHQIIGCVLIYNSGLSADQIFQNFNVFRGKYGV